MHSVSSKLFETVLKLFRFSSISSCGQFKTLLFGVTTRVTRSILPKVTPLGTSYFLQKLVTHMISMFVDFSFTDSIIDSSFA